MKTRIVLVSLVATMMALNVSAQRAEYDDMYFTSKDRERNKAIEGSVAPIKAKKQKDEEPVAVDEDNSNPTDSYSARNVNPEYVSRENSEKASEDESNYYVEGYTPAVTPSYSNSYYGNTGYYNNSYYNNSNWARNSWYGMNSPYYSPYSSFGYGGYYDPWMMNSPYYGGGSGITIGFSYGFGNYYGGPMGYGMNYGYPYYGGYGNYYGGYSGYPTYYYGGNYGETSGVSYGKRPSRHSAIVTPSQRVVTRTNAGNNTTAATNGRTRTRQSQDDYYVRPSRRTSGFDNPSRTSSSNPTFENSGSGHSGSGIQPSRTRDSYNPPRESRTPSYSPPSSSPSPSRGGSGGGGGSSPRPRGRG